MKKVSHYYILLATAIYVLVGAVLIYLVSGWVGQHYFNVMGENTQNLATLSANAMNVTNEQLKTLSSIPFDKLLKTTSNQELSRFFKKTSLNQDVKYAYVIRKLQANEIKYQVTNKDKDFYKMPVGTKLDWIWLMDVIVNAKEQADVEKDPDYYKDKNRYTHVDGDTVRLYNSRKSGFFINRDEWGDQISGMAPLYTKEGTYIGLLGVDVYSDGFYDYRNKVMVVLFLLLFIPTLILIIIFLRYHLRYRKEMKSMVFRDKLTGLFTRIYYENYARQQLKMLRRSEDSMTVLMMDIDDFKAYNDFYGHLQGDVILKEISMVIQQAVELDGGCPGRYGGEEFIAFVPNLSVENGDLLCDTICKKIEVLQLIHENKKDPKIVTISIGIHTAEMQDGILEMKRLIDKADKALYMAKHDGKNCYRRVE